MGLLLNITDGSCLWLYRAHWQIPGTAPGARGLAREVAAGSGRGAAARPAPRARGEAVLLPAQGPAARDSPPCRAPKTSRGAGLPPIAQAGRGWPITLAGSARSRRGFLAAFIGLRPLPTPRFGRRSAGSPPSDTDAP